MENYQWVYYRAAKYGTTPEALNHAAAKILDNPQEAYRFICQHLSTPQSSPLATEIAALTKTTPEQIEPLLSKLKKQPKANRFLTAAEQYLASYVDWFHLVDPTFSTYYNLSDLLTDFEETETGNEAMSKIIQLLKPKILAEFKAFQNGESLE